jgi:Amt family ammonium transporter
MFASWALTGKGSVIGAAAGAVAGLVAITPASGFVQPMEAIVIGGVAGSLCYLAVRLRAKIGLDDSLDVVGVHGVGGMWGGIGTGLFATAAIGAGGAGTGIDGLVQGEASQMVDQIVAIGVVAIYSFVVTAIILKVLDLTIGIRLTESDEELGMDVTQHGERGYVFDVPIGVPMATISTPPIPAPQSAPRTESASGA